MEAAEGRRAGAAARSVASALGFAVEDAIVLSDSNRLVVRLLPCDVVARVAPMGYRVFPSAVGAARELGVVQRLAAEDAPVAALEPRVGPRILLRDGFEISLWTYCEPVRSREAAPEDHAHALKRLHDVMRGVALAAPHFADRAADVQGWVARPDVTPDLAGEDRELLTDRLGSLRRSIVGRGAAEQLLHGEPHPWNVLDTTSGPRFVDFENCVRGPVEFDLGWVPEAVSDRYPGADPDLVRACRGLVLAMVAAHAWRPRDHRPGPESREAFLDAVRTGPPWRSLDSV